MWRTIHASALLKNLGLGLNFQPCSEDCFLSGCLQSVSKTHLKISLRITHRFQCLTVTGPNKKCLQLLGPPITRQKIETEQSVDILNHNWNNACHQNFSKWMQLRLVSPIDSNLLTLLHQTQKCLLSIDQPKREWKVEQSVPP